MRLARRPRGFHRGIDATNASTTTDVPPSPRISLVTPLCGVADLPAALRPVPYRRPVRPGLAVGSAKRELRGQVCSQAPLRSSLGTSENAGIADVPVGDTENKPQRRPPSSLVTPLCGVADLSAALRPAPAGCLFAQGDAVGSAKLELRGHVRTQAPLRSSLGTREEGERILTQRLRDHRGGAEVSARGRGLVFFPGPWTKHGWAMVRKGKHAQVVLAFHGKRGERVRW